MTRARGSWFARAMDNITNESVAWAIFLYLVAPVLYCAVAGAFCRGRRGASRGALIGIFTTMVTIAGGVMISEYALSKVNFFLQAQATAIAGAFVAGWSTRFMSDEEEGGGG